MKPITTLLITLLSVWLYQNQSLGQEIRSLQSLRNTEKGLLVALQEVKIDHGMYSALQIPVIEKLIETQIQQRNWEAVNQHFAYFDWLNSKLYQTNLESFFEGTQILSQLYLNAAAAPSNLQSGHYLVAAKNLNWQAVTLLENIAGQDSYTLTPWLYRIVLSHVYQSNLIQRRGLTSYDYKTDQPTIVNGWSLSKNESLEKSYNIGNELLERIRNIELANSNPEGAAIAELYLGDWDILFENELHGVAHYQAATLILLDAGVTQADIDMLFSKNSVLPETQFFSSFDQLSMSEGNYKNGDIYEWSSNFPAVAAVGKEIQARDFHSKPAAARVRFDLNEGVTSENSTTSEMGHSAFGISNLNLLSISSEASMTAKQALEGIALFKFRPRFENGQLVPSGSITVNYHFSEQAIPPLLSEN